MGWLLLLLRWERREDRNYCAAFLAASLCIYPPGPSKHRHQRKNVPSLFPRYTMFPFSKSCVGSARLSFICKELEVALLLQEMSWVRHSITVPMQNLRASFERSNTLRYRQIASCVDEKFLFPPLHFPTYQDGCRNEPLPCHKYCLFQKQSHCWYFIQQQSQNELTCSISYQYCVYAVKDTDGMEGICIFHRHGNCSSNC